jgi:hypothetical protein
MCVRACYRPRRAPPPTPPSPSLFLTSPGPLTPQGIAFLVASGLLRSDPGEVAAFLKSGGALPDGRESGEPLNRRAVGEFLGAQGGRDEDARDFHRAMLRAYASRFPFAGRTFTQALRLFLSEFRLPGEAQMIDRLMAAFAEAFARENAGTFPSPDAAYVLAFACIMLNTDLHKGGVKHKMTAEQFAANLRSAAAGGGGGGGGAPAPPPPAHLLAEVYADIAAAPLALDADPSFLTFFSPVKQGWLLKRCTGPLPRWKRRFFLLADGVLYYFSSETDVAAGKPRLILPLDDTALQLVGSLGLRIVPRGAVGSGGGSSGGEGGGEARSAAAAAAAGRRASAGSPAKLAAAAAPAASAAAASPAGAVRFPGPLHSPRGSDDGGVGSGSGGGGGGGEAPSRRLALTLKTAKRTDDGTVRRGRYGDFELRAESARERDEWAAAVSAPRAAPRLRNGSRLKEVAEQRGVPAGSGGSGSAAGGAAGAAAGAAAPSAAAIAAAAIAAAAGAAAGEGAAPPPGDGVWRPQGSSQRPAAFPRPPSGAAAAAAAGAGGAASGPPSAPPTPRKPPPTPVLGAASPTPLYRPSASRENLLAVVTRLKGAESAEELNTSGAGGAASGEEEASSDEDVVDETAFKEEAVVTLTVRAPAAPPAGAAAASARPREGSSWGLLGDDGAEEDVWRLSPQQHG